MLDNFKNQFDMSYTKQRFTIKKLSVGVVSVLVGFTFWGFNGQSASADVVSVIDSTITSTPATDVTTADATTTPTSVTDAATADATTTPTSVTDAATADGATTSVPVTDAATADGATTSVPVTDATIADGATTSVPVTDATTADGATTSAPATDATTLVTNVTTENNNGLVIDGVNVIESGVTNDQTQHTINGKIVNLFSGNPLEVNNTAVATPLANVRVYAQWMEKSGAMSPIYTTTSDGDGFYHILMKEFILPNGEVAKFDADPNLPVGEKWRVWAQTPTGMQLYYSWENSQFGPQGSAMDTSYSAEYNLALAQLNNFNFIFTPLTDNAVMHDMANVRNSPHINEQGWIRGKVFWNNTVNSGSQKVDATDTYARNVTVVGSYLSDYALSRIYTDGKDAIGVNEIRGTGWTDIQEVQLQNWIKQQIIIEGTSKWIAETVAAKVSNGAYEIQFNGTFGASWDNRGRKNGREQSPLYFDTPLSNSEALSVGLTPGVSTYSDLFQRVAPDPFVGTFQTGWTVPRAILRMAPKHVNFDWSYVSVQGVENYGLSSIYFGNKFVYNNPNSDSTTTTRSIKNLDFVLFPDEFLFDVVHYDTTQTFAAPGDVVTTNTQGLPGLELGNNIFKIIWYDMDGNPVQTSLSQIPDSTGTLKSADFKVPSNAQDGAIYTAKLYPVDSKYKPSDFPMAMDSFAVRTLTALNNPNYTEGTVPQGGMLTIPSPTFDNPSTDGIETNSAPDGTKFALDREDFPGMVSIDENTGAVTIVVDSEAPVGEYTIPVIVTYRDNSTDKVNVKVNVIPNEETHTPIAQDQTVKVDQTPVAGDSIKNMDKLPAGTTAEFKTPVDTSTPGPKDAVVVVTYPDGSTDEVPTKVIVEANPTQAETNEPVAQDQVVKVGETPVASDSIKNMSELPEGTIYNYKEPVDTTTPGPKDAVVVVNYPDGSTDEVPAKVIVEANPTQAETNEPVAQDQTVKVGEELQAEDSIANKSELPEGTIYNYKTPVDTTTPGPKDAVVVVTYPDGSTDEVPAKVIVEANPTQAETNEPVAQDQTVKVGEEPQAEDSIANKSELPEGTIYNYKEPVDTTTPGPKDAVVVVTYPDGSTDEVPTKVIVEANPTQAETNEPVAQDRVVKVGETPVASDSIKNMSELPEGTIYNYKEPVDTTTPGPKDAVVVVTYPDGSTDEVPAKVIVEANPTQAETNEPVAQDQVVKVGETPVASDSIKNMSELPEGTIYNYKEPVDTTTPGPKDAVVVVTYPDGLTDEVPTKVIVEANPTQAETNEPVAQDQVVKVGETPVASDSIKNMSELPEGTIYNYKEPVDTTTPGPKDAVVVVTYPDGLTDEVPTKVIVEANPTQAETNEPVAQDQVVKVGETPVASDSIKNMSELPEGTIYNYKTPVDTTTPGPKDAVVVVNYPDGSTDEVPAKVIVEANPTQAETNEPVVQDQNRSISKLVNKNSNLSAGTMIQKDKSFDENSVVGTNYATELPSTGVSEKQFNSIFGILSISIFGVLLTVKLLRKKD